MLLRENPAKKLHRRYLIFLFLLSTLIFYVFQTHKFSILTEERLIINENIIHDLDLTVHISSSVKDLPRVTFFDADSAQRSSLNNTTIPESVNASSNKYLQLSDAGSKPTRRLPDALVIGVKKCGTRALLEFLRIHPDVRAAGSEVHFFDKHYSKGFEWYRRRMPTTLPGQVTMEKTPSYFVTRDAPARVYEMNPAVRLLLVVRDPVTRAVSDYTQASTKRNLSEFEKLVFVSETSVVDTGWSPVRLGLYCHHLRPWLHLFNLSQILFVSGERLISDPAAQMAQVQDFLGLKRVVTEKHFYFNATKGFPCLLKSERRPTPHCLGKNKGRNHPPINPSVLRALRTFYRPFNARFYKLTGIDFGWQ